MKNYEYVWVFNANHTTFPCAVFSSEEKAKHWIRANKVSGTLTEYPIDTSAYEHAVESELFTPRKEHEHSVRFIETFSPRTHHSHWADGE